MYSHILYVAFLIFMGGRKRGREGKRPWPRLRDEGEVIFANPVVNFVMNLSQKKRKEEEGGGEKERSHLRASKAKKKERKKDYPHKLNSPKTLPIYFRIDIWEEEKGGGWGGFELLD